MATARDLITGALRLIGAVSTNETPSAAEQSDALSALNDLLASWSNEGLVVFQTLREEFDLVAGQQTYTIGPSGDFDTERPLRINNALVQTQASPQAELGIKLIELDEWARLIVKSVQSPIPRYLYFEATYPLAKINLWPVPSVTTKLILYMQDPLASLANSNATIDLPPGYARALRFNLALELAPEYGKNLDPLVMQNAMEAKENIKRINIRTHLMKTDPGAMPGSKIFNWLTGE